MGGEHSLTYSCVKAFQGKPAHKDRIGFVVMDAHYDLREEYEGIRNSHACVSRHIIEDITDRYVSIGVRSGPKEEYEYVKKNKKIRSYTANDVDGMGIDRILDETEAYLEDCDGVVPLARHGCRGPCLCARPGHARAVRHDAAAGTVGHTPPGTEGRGLRRRGDLARV